MKDGDLVVLPRKRTSQIAIGRVSGPYAFREVDGTFRHTRPVKWLQTELPRTIFEQDLLYSFGAFMTVCRISRNDAERRVAAVADGKPDPGPLVSIDTSGNEEPGSVEPTEGFQTSLNSPTTKSSHTSKPGSQVTLLPISWMRFCAPMAGKRSPRLPVRTVEWTSLRDGAR